MECHTGGWRSGIFRDFSELLLACPPRVRVGALCLPCAPVLLVEARGGLVTAPHFSRNFPVISRNSPQSFASGVDAP